MTIRDSGRVLWPSSGHESSMTGVTRQLLVAHAAAVAPLRLPGSYVPGSGAPGAGR